MLLWFVYQNSVFCGTYLFDTARRKSDDQVTSFVFFRCQAFLLNLLNLNRLPPGAQLILAGSRLGPSRYSEP